MEVPAHWLQVLNSGSASLGPVLAYLRNVHAWRIAGQMPAPKQPLHQGRVQDADHRVAQGARGIPLFRIIGGPRQPMGPVGELESVLIDRITSARTCGASGKTASVDVRNPQGARAKASPRNPAPESIVALKSQKQRSGSFQGNRARCAQAGWGVLLANLYASRLKAARSIGYAKHLAFFFKVRPSFLDCWLPLRWSRERDRE